MTTSTSIVRCINADIKRGLSNRRFWAVLGICSLVFFLYQLLSGIWPLTLYYFASPERLPLYSAIPYDQEGMIRRLNRLTLFGDYFPFLSAAAYAYVILDDRRKTYCVQQIQRIGFSNYYWGKLISSGLLGGLTGALCEASICLQCVLVVGRNPLIKDAVAYYTKGEMELLAETPQYNWIGWAPDQAYFRMPEPSWQWWMVAAFKYFVMGCLYGLLAALIAFFISNAVMVYAGPILFALLWDKGSYVILSFLGEENSLSNLIYRVSLRSDIESYGSLYHYSLLFFMIILLLIIAKHSQGRIERTYLEGGTADG